MNLDISLVLVPIKEQEMQIRQTIEYLADKYHSYPFIPHVTVYYLGFTTKLDEIINFIDTSLVDINRFDIELNDLSFSDVFSKTLFANYKMNTPLLQLENILHKQFNSIRDYHLAPHLSLIYKNNMKNEDKVSEIARIMLPKKLTIDRLYVITNEKGFGSEENNVLHWKVAHQITFK